MEPPAGEGAGRCLLSPRPFYLLFISVIHTHSCNTPPSISFLCLPRRTRVIETSLSVSFKNSISFPSVALWVPHEGLELAWLAVEEAGGVDGPGQPCSLLLPSIVSPISTPLGPALGS